ncbi:MAG: HEAT repeat domain-containing protein [Spirochaetes bacterium]|nr:HEAT repeat domain-containing protein [Spirochaetota bacterium]
MGLFTPNIEKLIDNDDVDGLLKLIDHKKADIRLQAFLALSRKKDERIIEKLKTLLKDPDPKVQAVATLRFGELDKPTITSNIRRIIINGTQREKIEALRLIASKGKTDNPEISKILYLALQDKKPIVKIEAIRAIGATKDLYSEKHLIDLLEDKSSQIRTEAVKALGELATETCVDPIIGSLIDNHQDVRKAAHEALKKIGTPKALNAVHDAPFMLLVKRMTESESVRRETVIHIGAKRIREAVPLLQKACFDEYKNIRLEAVKSLGLIREKSAVPTMIKLLDDPFYDVRLETVRALEKIFDHSALFGIEKAMKTDKNRVVRAEAQKAYYSLKSRLDAAGIQNS